MVESNDYEPSPSPKLSQKEKIDDLNETQIFDEKPPPYHPSPQYYTQPHHFSSHQPHHYYHHWFSQMMLQSPAGQLPVSIWKTYKVGETHSDGSLVTNTHCMWCGILRHSVTEKGKTVCKVKIAGKPQTEFGKSFENIKKLSGKAMLLSEFPALSMNEFSFALLDSGAFPNIMMNDSCIHNNIHPSSSFVYTATGEKVSTKLEGNSVIETNGNSLEIGQTKILEKIPYNLLSVGVICDQLDTTIVFDKDSVKILSDSPNLDHINILGSAA